jgi:hypothetical protein
MNLTSLEMAAMVIQNTTNANIFSIHDKSFRALSITCGGYE